MMDAGHQELWDENNRLKRLIADLRVAIRDLHERTGRLEKKEKEEPENKPAPTPV